MRDIDTKQPPHIRLIFVSESQASDDTVVLMRSFHESARLTMKNFEHRKFDLEVSEMLMKYPNLSFIMGILPSPSDGQGVLVFKTRESRVIKTDAGESNLATVCFSTKGLSHVKVGFQLIGDSFSDEIGACFKIGVKNMDEKRFR